MYRITPQLYISPYIYASSDQTLCEYRITHIVNLAAEHPNVFPTLYTYLRIPARDTLHERLGPWFHTIASFISRAQSSGGIVLVHCTMGISRSATGVLAALMLNERMRLSTAFAMLKAAKPNVEPNRAFMRELRALDVDLFGEWSSMKLTPWDDVRAPAKVGEWREEVAVLLAIAAMGEEVTETDMVGEVKIVHGEWRERVRGCVEMVVGDKGLVSVEDQLMALLSKGLESYGGRNMKDVRARKAFGSLVKGLTGTVLETNDELSRALQKMSESEDWTELKLDVPVAELWLKALLHELKMGTEENLRLQQIDNQ
jgi:Dual specificity phosphatase, catalytic domain